MSVPIKLDRRWRNRRVLVGRPIRANVYCVLSRFLKVEKHAASKETQNCGTPKRGEYESERRGNLSIVRVTHDDKRGAEYRTWCPIRRKDRL